MKGFEELARQRAIASSLPLLATYFSGADTWNLRPQEAVSPTAELDRELAQAVRLRVLLALGHELVDVITAIVEQPSFRYGRRSEDSVGVVRGRLDVPRYARARGQVESPRRYPIHQVERHAATPENVLATAALEALGRELAGAPAHVLEQAGPERREIAHVQATLARLGQLPLLAEVRAEGRRNADGRDLQRLSANVVRRLERREIRQGRPYEALVEWVDHLLSPASARPDSRRWSFYEEDFDARLFEIWLLGSLSRALSEKYGPPEEGRIRPLWERDELPLASWGTPLGSIQLFVQRATKGLGLPGWWKLRGAQSSLGARPDIVLRLSTPDLTRYVVIDAKLRRYDPLPLTEGEAQNLPSEEIYKMLGYFEHLRLDPDSAGALVYYTPGFARTALLESKPGDHHGGGALLLAGVDPALVDESRRAVGAIVEQVAELLGEPSREVREEATALELEAIEQGADATEAVAVGKARIFGAVAAGYSDRHPRQRQTVEATTSASFTPEVWAALEDESRKMLVSSEMYALHVGEDADFSGPLLVLCAACERELNRRVFAPFAEARDATVSGDPSGPISEHPPLGTGVYVMRKAADLLRAREKDQPQKVDRIIDGAPTEQEGQLWSELADWLETADLKHQDLAPLVEGLASMNKKYRRPSAHDKTVAQRIWIAGRGEVLGPDRLLGSIVSTFG